jgi:hypothetical protein
VSDCVDYLIIKRGVQKDFGFQIKITIFPEVHGLENWCVLGKKLKKIDLRV